MSLSWKDEQGLDSASFKKGTLFVLLTFSKGDTTHWMVSSASFIAGWALGWGRLWVTCRSLLWDQTCRIPTLPQDEGLGPAGRGPACSDPLRLNLQSNTPKTDSQPLCVAAAGKDFFSCLKTSRFKRAREGVKGGSKTTKPHASVTHSPRDHRCLELLRPGCFTLCHFLIIV